MMASSKQTTPAREARAHKSGFLTFSASVLNVKKIVMWLDRTPLLRAAAGAGCVAVGVACGSPDGAERRDAPDASVSVMPSATVSAMPLLYARLTNVLCDPAMGCATEAPLTLDMFDPPEPALPPAPAPAPADAEQALTPLTTKKPLVSIPVAGFEDAIVAIPSGATGPAPVVIAMHGHFDRPEQFCAAWATIFQNKAFILCPRGVLAPGSPWGDKRFSFLDQRSAERELDAALAALRNAPFAGYVDAVKPVYAGFSLGAFVGLPIARRRGGEFSSMIFVEGNLDHMSGSMIDEFVGAGGRQLMLVCADGKEAHNACSIQANRIVKRLEGMGGAGMVIDAGRAGHSYEGQVAKALASTVPTFVQGDPRFASLLVDAAPSAVVNASMPLLPAPPITAPATPASTVANAGAGAPPPGRLVWGGVFL
jgi:hypothetical protein